MIHLSPVVPRRVDIDVESDFLGSVVKQEQGRVVAIGDTPRMITGVITIQTVFAYKLNCRIPSLTTQDQIADYGPRLPVRINNQRVSHRGIPVDIVKIDIPYATRFNGDVSDCLHVRVIT
jgi:hypothetical protein